MLLSMFVTTLEAFRRDRYAAPLASRSVVFWYARANLRIISAWGVVGADDMRLVTAAMSDELAPGFTPFSSLVDMTEIESLDSDSFGDFVAFMREHVDAFARVNLQSAYIHGGDLFASSAVSGYTQVIGNPFPTSNFADVTAGLRGLGFGGEADEIVLALGDRKRLIRDTFRVLGPLREAILKHIASPTSAAIAAELKVSTRTLQRELAAVETDLTREVRRIRIAAAKELLATTELTIVEVTARLGFGATKTFRSAFRREVGELPAAWRSRRRHDDPSD